MSHKPGGRLPLLSARPVVTLATLKRVATNFAAWWTEAQWVWTVCLKLLPDSVATAIWTRALLRLSQHANRSATEPPHPSSTRAKFGLQETACSIFCLAPNFTAIGEHCDIWLRITTHIWRAILQSSEGSSLPIKAKFVLLEYRPAIYAHLPNYIYIGLWCHRWGCENYLTTFYGIFNFTILRWCHLPTTVQKFN